MNNLIKAFLVILAFTIMVIATAIANYKLLYFPIVVLLLNNLISTDE